MSPDENTNTSGHRGQLTPPARSTSGDQQSAVANMTRDQISALYSQQPADESTSSPYERTEHVDHHTTDGSWQNYHTAWQDYYQKYYEHYYLGAVQQVHSTYQQHAEQLHKSAAASIAAAKQPTDSQTVSQEEAIDDLRQQLVGKVRAQALTIRRSHHFMPIVSALVVLSVFVFLQYNSMIVGYAKAYVSPGSSKPQDIIVNPNLSSDVGSQSRLIIPKININVGVNYNTKPTNDTNVKGNLIDAMRSKVAYFGGYPGVTSLPGQLGNFGLSGHSSNEWYTSGSEELKFVFVRLPDMRKGDIFYLNYKGTRYTYSVSQILTVKPSEATKLNIGYGKPYATLITCVPIGTANERLFVIGEQISPDPTLAQKPGATTSQATPQISGKEPTVLERLFNGN